MKLLGSIGIDIRLLFAQIINFLVLLWLLSKFIYRPIIARIEKDEKELEESKTEQERLGGEKIAFARQKEEELRLARDRSRQIIEEAELIGKKMGQQARDKMEQEGAAIITQKEKQAVAAELAARRHVVAEFADRVERRLKELFRKDFSSETISDMLFGLLLEEVKALPSDMIGRAISEATLEYVRQPGAKQKSLLAVTLKKRFRKEIKMTMRKNNLLINGFRLEWDGIVIESNIAHSIHDATKSE